MPATPAEANSVTPYWRTASKVISAKPTVTIAITASSTRTRTRTCVTCLRARRLSSTRQAGSDGGRGRLPHAAPLPRPSRADKSSPAPAAGPKSPWSPARAGAVDRAIASATSRSATRIGYWWRPGPTADMAAARRRAGAPARGSRHAAAMPRPRHRRVAPLTGPDPPRRTASRRTRFLCVRQSPATSRGG